MSVCGGAEPLFEFGRWKKRGSFFRSVEGEVGWFEKKEKRTQFFPFWVWGAGGRQGWQGQGGVGGVDGGAEKRN